MKRAALAVTLLAASSGVASAGGYVGLGIGTGPSLSTDRATDFEADGRSGRFLVGSRWGKFSVEGAVGGFDMVGPAPHKVWQASASGKFSLPLGDGFEAYGRLGLHKTWSDLQRDRDGDEQYDTSGIGYLVAAGFEYRLNLTATNLSFWVDYQYSNADLKGDRASYELSTRMWTLGATIGF